MTNDEEKGNIVKQYWFGYDSNLMLRHDSNWGNTTVHSFLPAILNAFLNILWLRNITSMSVSPNEKQSMLQFENENVTMLHFWHLKIVVKLKLFDYALIHL